MSDQEMIREPLGDSWLIECDFIEHEITTGIWVTTQTQLTHFNLSPSHTTKNCAELTLSHAEIDEYINNTSSIDPKLYVIIEEPSPQRQLSITASIAQARRARELGLLVLSHSMPIPILNWINAFLN
jgi:hypothetical protein